MPLTMARLGECVTIKKITGKNDTIKFLNRLGFIEGHQVAVVLGIAGNLIINIKDTQIVRDKTLSSRIVGKDINGTLKTTPRKISSGNTITVKNLRGGAR